MGNYVTAAEVQNEGVPGSVPVPRIDARIVKWEAIVERMTRLVFREVAPGELTFDGNNSAILHFSLPLISVTSVKINGETTALDTDEYRAFTGRTLPQDDRFNPKIKLTPVRGSVYRTAPSMFVKGLDQLITATWGFVDDDGAGGYECPQPVKDAIIKLVVLDLADYFSQGQGGAGAVVTPKKRERTDGHEIEWMDIDNVTAIWKLIPGDIADVLGMYRAPWLIGAPEPTSFFYDPGIEVLSY